MGGDGNGGRARKIEYSVEEVQIVIKSECAIVIGLTKGIVAEACVTIQVVIEDEREGVIQVVRKVDIQARQDAAEAVQNRLAGVTESKYASVGVVEQVAQAGLGHLATLIAAHSVDDLGNVCSKFSGQLRQGVIDGIPHGLLLVGVNEIGQVFQFQGHIGQTQIVRQHRFRATQGLQAANFGQRRGRAGVGGIQVNDVADGLAVADGGDLESAGLVILQLADAERHVAIA